eukprot:TRINITY_DN16982_c0_g1_i1.p1 TRINITY_DN16982_c0_g1~~TRINITY_DN16982_c0_g1_i1.p1  ORF type:complete len:455 (+),score=138.77 TRINITY_DN16982_c0_g1_i1:43-1407(+)
MSATKKNGTVVKKVFRGSIVHCAGAGAGAEAEFIEHGAVGVDAAGNVAFVQRDGDAEHEYLPCTTVVDLPPTAFLVPGFVDAHLHAPQYSFLGIGSELTLLDWLKKYTFTFESRFKDLEFASKVYRRVVERTLYNGTTTACYFATIHPEASKLLVQTMHEIGQRGFVGKVNMDRNSPDFYVETSAQSLQRTREFIDFCNEFASPLVKPIITPRFVPTCTSELMNGLSELAEEHHLLIQSHVSENVNEITWVKELHPECDSYSATYDAHGLLNSNTILAHGVHLTEPEMDLLAKKGSAIIHCPTSNFDLSSGVCNVRNLMRHKVKVGLGSDISGGHNASMLAVMRDVISTSRAVAFLQTNNMQNKTGNAINTVSYLDAFYLATLGGACALGLDSRVGNFVPGKAFDALVVDVAAPGSPIDTFGWESLQELFQKFFFTGDDRNITQVFVQGAAVKK